MNRSRIPYRVYELKMQSNLYLENVGKVLNLFVDDKIPDETSFGEIKGLAFKILEKKKFPFITRYISKIKFDEVEFAWNKLTL